MFLFRYRVKKWTSSVAHMYEYVEIDPCMYACPLLGRRLQTFPVHDKWWDAR